MSLWLLLVLLICVCSSEVQTDDNVTTVTTAPLPYRGFDAAFPKVFDTLAPRYCRNGRCYYTIMIAGWFWDGLLPTDIIEGCTFYVHMFEYNVTTIRRAEKAYQHPIGNLFLETKVPFDVAEEITDIQIRLDIHNAENVTIFSRVSQFVLLNEKDLSLPNQLTAFTQFAEHLKSSKVEDEVQQNQLVLDFFEIGTSDYSTAIHSAVEMMQTDRVNHSMLGISMDPVLRYQQSLPHLDSVFKLNAAINTKAHANETATLYYLPDNVLQAIEYHDRRFTYVTRGCFAINTIHPMAMQSMFECNLPAFLMMKQPVRSYTIDDLWNSFVLSHFAAVRLLKIDVEGLDQIVMGEFLDMYEDLEKQGKRPSWPCMIEFETNELSGFRDEALLQRLEAVGYHLQHKVMNNMELISPFSGLINKVSLILHHSSSDTIGFHCSCTTDDLRIASQLVLLEEETDQPEFMEYVCNRTVSSK